MLTVLEILIIAVNIPVLIWALLPAKRVPRFLDFLPSAAVVFMILHLFIDNEAVRFRFVPLYIFTVTVFLITIRRIFRHDPDQPKRRVRAAFGRVAGLAALALAVLMPVVVLPFYPLPEPTGNFDVGTVVCDLTDKNRTDAFSNEAGKNREIAVQFWYPADRTGAAPEYDIDGVPVSASQREYPVLIFSHGAFGMRMSNASTYRELASHGYIVASIDHTYHSFLTSFADGRKVPVNMKFINDAVGAQSGQMPAEEVYKASHEWLELRTADIELVIDSLETGDIGDAGKILNGHMELNRIGLFGHSLGGAASAQVGREREEVSAVIDIDGTMIGDITGLDANDRDIVTDESYTKPVMMMYGSLFLDNEAKETAYLPNIHAYENDTEAAYSLCIKDSGHLNFTDLSRISPFLSGMLGVGKIDSQECLKIMDAYTLAFFDRYIKEQPSTLLEGENVYPEAIFDKRIPAGE